MFDVAWSEIAVIIMVALVIIGPKDIPVVIKTVKGWMAKLYALKSEVNVALNAFAKETEIAQAVTEMHNETIQVNKKIQQIVDLEGNLRDAYDISDIRPAIRTQYSVENAKEIRVVANYSLNKETIH